MEIGVEKNKIISLSVHNNVEYKDVYIKAWHLVKVNLNSIKAIIIEVCRSDQTKTRIITATATLGNL